MTRIAIIPPGSPKPLAPYSPGILADGVLYVSGILALDASNDVVHVGDAAGQTRQVLETIKSVIEAAGGTLESVVYNAIFLKDWADYAEINAVYAEYFSDPYPARYCIQGRLVKEDALSEISSIAHVKTSSSS
jgi:aminoacrylate peracid reductase